jgi:hypothetical protein
MPVTFARSSGFFEIFVASAFVVSVVPVPVVVVVVVVVESVLVVPFFDPACELPVDFAVLPVLEADPPVDFVVLPAPEADPPFVA